MAFESLKNKIKLNSIKSIIKKELDEKFSRLGFTYKVEEKRLVATAENVSLRNHDDDILFTIEVYLGGRAYFEAVFDKIEKTDNVMHLLNEFNHSNLFFTAFIREDGYLVLRHTMAYFENKIFKNYPDEVLGELGSLADDEVLQKLTALTN